jgi:hypothetical protein
VPEYALATEGNSEKLLSKIPVFRPIFETAIFFIVLTRSTPSLANDLNEVKAIW